MKSPLFPPVETRWLMLFRNKITVTSSIERIKYTPLKI
jgi:hypothetical protein